MSKISRTALTALLGSTAFAAAPHALAQENTEDRVLDTVVIRGVNIPDEKRETSEISSVLDELSFERTGDSDIAGALARVSGISVTDGKFVVVRGLNERYSSVTINGSPLPSPEPLRRVVPLDLIPTSFLSGALVQKTFSPQYSGEFGGGLVELRTKAIPDEFYFSVGGSIGFDTVTTGETGLTQDGGDLDGFGFDDGTRAIPSLLESTFFGFDGLPATIDQDAIDATFSNPPTEIGFAVNQPPNYNVSFGFGGAVDLTPNIVLGANFAVNFGNDFQTREGRRERGLAVTALNADSAPITGDFSGLGLGIELFDFTSTTQEVSLNGLAAFGLEIGSNHDFSWTNFILRSTSIDTRIQQGVNTEESASEIFVENFEFFERQVYQTQLNGEHLFPGLFDLEVRWRGAYGEAFREAPFQREILRGRDSLEDDFVLPFGPSFGLGSIESSAVSLTFSDVNDDNIDAGIDFVLPVPIFGGEVVDLKFGYAYTDKDRVSVVRDFLFQGSPLFPDELATTTNDIFFSPEVLGSGLVDATFITNPISLDNAFSELLVNAAYFGIDAPVGPYFRLAAGFRFESGEQTTEAFATSLPDTTLTETVIDENDFLPTVTLTWNPIGNLQLRFGFSQTITRPQFRELTPALFLDDESDQLVLGNPFLVNSEIDNFDGRLEYYFGRGQFITIGGFYKDISNPIEATASDVGGSSVRTFVNAPSADLWGIEVEYEQTFDLDNVFNGRFLPGRDLVVKANYTFSQSDVSADGEVIQSLIDSGGPAEPDIVAGSAFIVDGRSLEGQSDNLFNFQLGLENPDVNSKATLLLNFASERIVQTENILSDSVVAAAVDENPPILLDFVWTRDIVTFGRTFEIGFTARNLLGDDFSATQSFDDGTVGEFDTFELGRELSVSFKHTF